MGLCVLYSREFFNLPYEKSCTEFILKIFVLLVVLNVLCDPLESPEYDTAASNSAYLDDSVTEADLIPSALALI